MLTRFSINSFVIRCLILAFSMLVAVQLLHGFSYATFTVLLEAVLLFGFLSGSVDFFLRTARIQELLPKRGLFQFLGNTMLLILVSKIVPSFYLNSIATALWGSFIVAFVSSLMDFKGSNKAVPSPTKTKKTSTMKQAKARVISEKSSNP